MDRAVSLRLPKAKVGHEIGECEWTAAAPSLKHITSTLISPAHFPVGAALTQDHEGKGILGNVVPL